MSGWFTMFSLFVSIHVGIAKIRRSSSCLCRSERLHLVGHDVFRVVVIKQQGVFVGNKNLTALVGQLLT